jgi:hypothetical protein
LQRITSYFLISIFCTFFGIQAGKLSLDNQQFKNQSYKAKVKHKSSRNVRLHKKPVKLSNKQRNTLWISKLLRRGYGMRPPQPGLLKKAIETNSQK